MSDFIIPDPDISFDLDRIGTQPPTTSPTSGPTAQPTKEPTNTPTASPTNVPTSPPTATPTKTPTATPTATPIDAPTNDSEVDGSNGSGTRSYFYSCPHPPPIVITATNNQGEEVTIELPPPISTVMVEYDFELQIRNGDAGGRGGERRVQSEDDDDGDDGWDDDEDDEDDGWDDDDNYYGNSTSYHNSTSLKYGFGWTEEMKSIASELLPMIEVQIGNAVANSMRSQHISLETARSGTADGGDAADCEGYFVDSLGTRRGRGRRLGEINGHSRGLDIHRRLQQGVSPPQRQRRQLEGSSFDGLDNTLDMVSLIDPNTLEPISNVPISESTTDSSTSSNRSADSPQTTSLDSIPTYEHTKILSTSSSSYSLDPDLECSTANLNCYVIHGSMEATYIGYNEASVEVGLMRLIKSEMNDPSASSSSSSSSSSTRQRPEEIDNLHSNNGFEYELNFLGPPDTQSRTANTPTEGIASLRADIMDMMPEPTGFHPTPIGIGIIVALGTVFLMAVVSVFRGEDEDENDGESVEEEKKKKKKRKLGKKGKKSKKSSKPLGEETDADLNDDDDESDISLNRYGYDLESVVVESNNATGDEGGEEEVEIRSVPSLPSTRSSRSKQMQRSSKNTSQEGSASKPHKSSSSANVAAAASVVAVATLAQNRDDVDEYSLKDDSIKENSVSSSRAVRPDEMSEYSLTDVQGGAPKASGARSITPLSMDDLTYSVASSYHNDDASAVSKASKYSQYSRNSAAATNNSNGFTTSSSLAVSGPNVVTPIATCSLGDGNAFDDYGSPKSDDASRASSGSKGSNGTGGSKGSNKSNKSCRSGKAPSPNLTTSTSKVPSTPTMQQQVNSCPVVIEPSPVSSLRLQTVPETDLPPPHHDTPHRMSHRSRYPLLSPVVPSHHASQYPQYAQQYSPHSPYSRQASKEESLSSMSRELKRLRSEMSEDSVEVIPDGDVVQQVPQGIATGAELQEGIHRVEFEDEEEQWEV